MNQVSLIGRLTKPVEVRYTSGSQTAVARFSIAIDRPVKSGGEKQTDFPNIIVFGKQAENCERFLGKGRLVGIQGRIQTGSYTSKAGAKVYTTDVVASNVEFLDYAPEKLNGQRQAEAERKQEEYDRADGIPDGFAALDEDIPF